MQHQGEESSEESQENGTPDSRRAHANPWLTHLGPEDPERPAIPYAESVTFRVEQLHAMSCLALTRAGISDELARRKAADTMMQATLRLQREHAPGSQQEMVLSLLAEDPQLDGFRTELARSAQRVILELNPLLRDPVRLQRAVSVLAIASLATGFILGLIAGLFL